jgi:hypothetical protein
MEEHVFENRVTVYPAVPQPHFDDERTLLAARPVVPLKKLRTETSRRNRWFLTGAFAIAILLGAASALLAVYLKTGSDSNSVQLSQVDSLQSDATTDLAATSTSAAVSEENAKSDSPIVDNTDAQAARPVIAKKESHIQRRRIADMGDPEIIPPAPMPRLKEDDELHRIRDAVLFDQWQERRMRRVARRERRDRADRDLFHVDEIFEGTRRPQ